MGDALVKSGRRSEVATYCALRARVPPFGALQQGWCTILGLRSCRRLTRGTNSSAPLGLSLLPLSHPLIHPLYHQIKKSPWSVCVRPWQRQFQHQRLREVHKTPVAMAARHGRPCPKGAHEHLCAEHINNSSLACSFEPLLVMRYPYIICCILFISLFPLFG